MTRSAPRIHGRVEELALLSEYLDRAIAGNQQLVLLEGDPGVGKTALLRAFARDRARRLFSGPRIFYLCAPPEGAYRPVEHAVMATHRLRYRTFKGEQQATELASSLVVDWLSAVPVWGSLMAAVAATTRAMRRRTRGPEPKRAERVDQSIHALLRAAQRRPLVLLLDDLDRADRGAIAKLEALITIADEGARILIVGAYRPAAPGVGDPPVHSLRKTLPRQDELFVHRRLGGLDEPELGAWLAERFAGRPIPHAFLRWLHGATGGHPATVVATLRHLLDSGAIRRATAGWEFEDDAKHLDLPALGHTFADLSALNPYIAEVVQSAVVLGHEFDGVTLSELLDRDELAVEDQLALGVHYGLLVHLPARTAGGGELVATYRFASTHLHAALLRSLPVERRATLEQRADELGMWPTSRSPSPPAPLPAPLP